MPTARSGPSQKPIIFGVMGVLPQRRFAPTLVREYPLRQALRWSAAQHEIIAVNDGGPAAIAEPRFYIVAMCPGKALHIGSVIGRDTLRNDVPIRPLDGDTGLRPP